MIEIDSQGWLAIAAGPLVGSFITTAVARFDSGRSPVWGRSACRHCGHALGPLDLVPVLSWAAARGKCRYCRQAVSASYPATELAAAVIAFWAALALPPELLWVGCALGWTLLALALFDCRYLILPDLLTIGLLVGGLTLAYLDSPWTLLAHAATAATGFAIFLAMRIAYKRLRGIEGLGLGDVKLIAAAGAWINLDALPSLILVAALAGLAAVTVDWFRSGEVHREDPIPFGACLALAFWTVWVYGPLPLPLI